MVPDRQKVRTDGMDGRTDARTTPKLYPSDSSGDKNSDCDPLTYSEAKVDISMLSRPKVNTLKSLEPTLN